MDIIKLKSIARGFRTAIESMPLGDRPSSLKEFPLGACGDMTLLLGAYLSDMKVIGFEYIYGVRGCDADNNYASHAWLQNDQLIIDITADQFPEVNEPIIVSANSNWHNTFEVESRGIADFRLLNGNTDYLFSLYKKIIATIV